MAHGSASSITGAGPRLDYAQRPMLVFWETTRACLLACAHCRASATAAALPGELSTAEGKELIDQVAGFGRPYPILVLTGGDCLLREDIFELVDYAKGLGIPVALSPSVTPILDAEMVQKIVDSGVKAVSISLDGSSAEEHEDICNFLFDASQYGFIVRTVEAPFFRRIVNRRIAGDPAPETNLYRSIRQDISVELQHVTCCRPIDFAGRDNFKCRKDS